MNKQITVYTSNDCSSCVMVKKFLDYKGNSYQEVNIESNPRALQSIQNLTGQSRVPVTVVTDADGKQKVSVGYSAPQLSAVLV